MFDNVDRIESPLFRDVYQGHAASRRLAGSNARTVGTLQFARKTRGTARLKNESLAIRI
jgi:hypothetical protein